MSWSFPIASTYLIQHEILREGDRIDEKEKKELEERETRNDVLSWKWERVGDAERHRVTRGGRVIRTTLVGLAGKATGGLVWSPDRTLVRGDGLLDVICVGSKEEASGE